MYFVHKKIPETKGGGIPKSEGVLRGTLKFRSFLTLIGTFFGSMISYFAGVPVGTEGPSVLIGTSVGDLCNKATKKNIPVLIFRFFKALNFSKAIKLLTKQQQL